MPAIVAFIGHSEVGKTTLIEKLIKELKSRGYHVATMKHAGRESSLDEPGKDSWRHIQAGSETPRGSSRLRLTDAEKSLAPRETVGARNEKR